MVGWAIYSPRSQKMFSPYLEVLKIVAVFIYIDFKDRLWCVDRKRRNRNCNPFPSSIKCTIYQVNCPFLFTTWQTIGKITADAVNTPSTSNYYWSCQQLYEKHHFLLLISMEDLLWGLKLCIEHLTWTFICPWCMRNRWWDLDQTLIMTWYNGSKAILDSSLGQTWKQDKMVVFNKTYDTEHEHRTSDHEILNFVLVSYIFSLK